MFNRLSRLYAEKQITDTGLTNAVFKKWITEAEYTQLTGKQYVAPTPIPTYTLDEAASVIVSEVNK